MSYHRSIATELAKEGRSTLRERGEIQLALDKAEDVVILLRLRCFITARQSCEERKSNVRRREKQEKCYGG